MSGAYVAVAHFEGVGDYVFGYVGGAGEVSGVRFKGLQDGLRLVDLWVRG